MNRQFFRVIDDTKTDFWIYPKSDYEIRTYQRNITKECLNKNTMVVLPTGLGKTLIASVVMYNFFMWFPKSKIIFMAPTKPLVEQQKRACYSIMKIPLKDTELLTGGTVAKKRGDVWREKRIFFCTPQVVDNDIKKERIDLKTIVLLVFDEAHKASKNYSYCKIIEGIRKKNKKFRVLALTATPGNNKTTVQSVISNLLIENVSVRTEDDWDVKQYSYHKTLRTITVDLPQLYLNFLNMYQEHFINPVLLSLSKKKIINDTNPMNYSKNRIMAIKYSLNETMKNVNRELKSLIDLDLSRLVSIYHGHDLLMTQGISPFIEYLKGMKSGKETFIRKKIVSNPLFNNVINRGEELQKAGVCHPKISELERVVLSHFKKNLNSNPNTKVIVFAQYRDTIDLIVSSLSKYMQIRCMKFVGQSKKGGKGLTQLEQQQIIKKFKDGGYNCLASTSVGEEGLDIGNVDLIVCYDGLTSPIRMIQRQGRTGRKKVGTCYTLLTRGYEERKYKEGAGKRKNVLNQIKRCVSMGSYNLKIKNSWRLPFNPKIKFQEFKETVYQSPLTTRKRKKQKKKIGIVEHEKEYIIQRYGNLKLKKNKNYFKILFDDLTEDEDWVISQETKTPYIQFKHSNVTRSFLRMVKVLNSGMDLDMDFEEINFPLKKTKSKERVTLNPIEINEDNLETGGETFFSNMSNERPFSQSLEHQSIEYDQNSENNIFFGEGFIENFLPLDKLNEDMMRFDFKEKKIENLGLFGDEYIKNMAPFEQKEILLHLCDENRANNTPERKPKPVERVLHFSSSDEEKDDTKRKTDVRENDIPQIKSQTITKLPLFRKRKRKRKAKKKSNPNEIDKNYSSRIDLKRSEFFKRRK